MTTTSVFQGNFLEKPSSRVIRPPGGGSSNIFGAPEEVKPPTPKVNPPVAVATDETPATPGAVPEVATAATSEPAVATQCGSGEPSAGQLPKTTEVKSAIAPVDKSSAGDQKKKRMGYNPITGESYEIPENSGAKTSISVRQPPGGASSGLW